MKKRSIILVGGGGHCKSAIDLILSTKEFEIGGIVDVKENVGGEILGFPIIGTDDDLKDLVKKHDAFAVTVGQIKSPDLRIKIYAHLKNLEAEMPAIIAPSAYISSSAKIGAATMIFHHAVINAEVEIGENCIINNCALIEHETIVEPHCHISTGAILNGNVVVRQGSFVGSGATVRHGAIVGERVIIGAGSMVTKNVEAKTVVVGNPARAIKE